VVKVWSSPGQPRWSVTVYLGDSREALEELVDLTLDTYGLVGQRLAERHWGGGRYPAPTVHAPQREEERQA
jgi:hypothetical protein